MGHIVGQSLQSLRVRVDLFTPHYVTAPPPGRLVQMSKNCMNLERLFSFEPTLILLVSWSSSNRTWAGLTAAT